MNEKLIKQIAQTVASEQLVPKYAKDFQYPDANIELAKEVALMGILGWWQDHDYLCRNEGLDNFKPSAKECESHLYQLKSDLIYTLENGQQPVPYEQSEHSVASGSSLQNLIKKLS